MDKKKHPSKGQSVFADVVIEPREQTPSDSIRDNRSQYMKLLYPNGVTLILPGSFPASVLMEYVNAFRS